MFGVTESTDALVKGLKFLVFKTLTWILTLKVVRSQGDIDGLLRIPINICCLSVEALHGISTLRNGTYPFLLSPPHSTPSGAYPWTPICGICVSEHCEAVYWQTSHVSLWLALTTVPASPVNKMAAEVAFHFHWRHPWLLKVLFMTNGCNNYPDLLVLRQHSSHKQLLTLH